jgi:hypothetical protein
MKNLFPIVCLALVSSCARYQLVQKVKLVSFEENIKKGKSIGPISGEDCTWSLFGYNLGALPTINTTFVNAMNQADALESSGFGMLSSKDKSASRKVRYINNVSSETKGFDAKIIGKYCLSIKGNGFI